MSKSLEKLAIIKGHFDPKNIANKELFEEDFNTIEKELKEGEKNKQVFEIIKNKKVDMAVFLRCKNCDDYNNYWVYNEMRKLAQEEYKLMKEVLNKDYSEY